MSMMSAPSAIMRRAWARARSGATNRPPSENESGVTFRTPITAGYGRDNSGGNTGWSAGVASGAGLDVVAIMRSLCAVRAWESRYRSRAAGAPAKPLLTGLIGDLGLQLARLGDQVL